MKKTVICFLAIVMIIFGCIVLTTPETDTSGDAKNLETLKYLNIRNDTIYYVDELVILDSVAALENSSAIYLLVMFEDADGKHIIANMPINRDDKEIYDDVCDYLDDPTQSLGDLVISAYVKTEDFVDVDGKLKDYFDQGVRDYRLYSGDYAIAMSEQFDYLCDENGDPYDTVDGASTVGKVVGVLCIAGALWMIFVALRKSKAKKEAQPVSAAAQPAQSASSGPQVCNSSPSPNACDAARQQLDYYKSMHDDGYMTDEEFEAKRKQILDL